MTLLDPVAGVAGVAVAAIVALYFLKARRPPHQVSSTLWWRPVTLDRQASAPWQRLRPSWLLALQVVATCLVIGALVQPALVSAQALTGQTIVILDCSETMQATDVAPSRFAVAVAEAKALVGRLAPTARMTLIAMDADPTVVETSKGQRQPLVQALDRLRPTDGPADLADALQLAVAEAGPRATGTQLVVLSDGIAEPLGEPVTVPFPVQYRRIGISGENTGITALTVAPGLAGEAAVAHVQDFGQVPAHLTVEMFADGHLSDAQAVTVAPGGGRDVTFSVPPGTAYVKVTLGPADDLVADDGAVAVASAPRKLKVLLVSPGDVFLQKALALRPDVEVSAEVPSKWAPRQAADPAVDFFVFEGFVPPRLPSSAPYLLVGPPPDRALGIGGGEAPGPLLPAEVNDPLLYDVDLSDVDVARSADLSRSHFGRVVISSAAGPVLMVRDGGPAGPPAALLGTYLHNSNLVLRSAFPILLTHLSEYLAPGTVPSLSEVPGSAVSLSPGTGAKEVVVTRPDGHRDILAVAGTAAPARASQGAGNPGTGGGASPSSVPGTRGGPGPVLFTDTSEAGIYRVSVVGRNGSHQVSYLAVNPEGTAIAPKRAIDVVGAAGKALPTASLYRDLWPLFAVAALAVLLAEWVVYHRAH
ncbi:MAG: vWA domain-containing protein [Acidimicrobiales bacterium]